MAAAEVAESAMIGITRAEEVESRKRVDEGEMRV